MRRLLAAVATATVLAGCATGSADVPDCDHGDRVKKETPDCGWRHNGVYREWSWVRRGMETPPPGWSASREKKPITKGTGR